MYLLHRRRSAQLPEQVTYSVLTNSPVSWLSFPRTAIVQAPCLPKDTLKAQPESVVPPKATPAAVCSSWKVPPAHTLPHWSCSPGF